MNIEEIREKANGPGFGYDSENGSNQVILFLLAEIGELRKTIDYLQDKI